MVYKGYELLKAIADGEIKEGSKFEAEYETFVVRDGYLFVDYGNRQEYATSFELTWDFELIKPEINMIEELTNESEGTAREFNTIKNKINELVQVVNQLEEEMQKLKED